MAEKKAAEEAAKAAANAPAEEEAAPAEEAPAQKLPNKSKQIQKIGIKTIRILSGLPGRIFYVYDIGQFC